MGKSLRQVIFLLVLGILVVISGGCGGSDSDKPQSSAANPQTPYPIVNADGAVLPKDSANWTSAEKSAWTNQGALLLNQIVSKEFKGRMTGDIGYERAAVWAAANFKNWGLEPLDGSYFQDFNISYSMPVNKSPVVKILVDGKVWKSTAHGDYIDAEFVKDIMSAHGTNTGTVRSKITFLGYGIDATSDNVYANNEFKHINKATVYRNDFNEYVGLTWEAGADPAQSAPTKTPLDVTNRVVIFRNATPNSLTNVDYRPTPIISGNLEPKDYVYTVGNDWIRHDEHYVKIAVARQRKAAGLLYNQMVANPNIRYQPPVGDNTFQIALVGSIGRNTKDGTLRETYYTNGTGDSRLLNDLFAKQLEIETASGGTKHTLTDLITRAQAVKTPSADGNGPARTVPVKNFGDGKGNVPDYPQFLYQATSDLFKGPNSTEGAVNSPYDKNYDASIATNSFHFDDSIEIEITTESESGVDVKGKNVVGVVRGSEFPDEYVIYMTHFDHCGFVGPHMTVGAADNGAGSTANMIAARYAAMMAASGHKPKRSLVFILDGAEESGMNGGKKAAAWFAANGRDKVKAIFHTDASFGKGNGNISLSTSMYVGLEPLKNELLNSTQNREHPWGKDAADIRAGASIVMNAPTYTRQAKYIGRPRTDTAAWQDEDMPVIIDVSAREENNTTSLYHAPYNDRGYVADHLMAILGIATANNMYTVANR